ncbi:MAG: pyridoxal-phosphate-dependent aminotransferase family protein [Candidatus Helarchaeota archaeon]
MKDTETELLMIPGPVQVHPRVYRAMSRPLMGHRSNEFSELMKDTTEKFQKLLYTKNDVFFITGSSTTAMESAIACLVSPGDKVLTIIQGKFSERWLNLVKAYGGVPIELNIEWGKPVLPEDITPYLEKDPEIKFITLCHNETSTGILNPGKEIGEVSKKYDKILIVDCVTSVGGDYVKPDEWNFDIVATGAQKCIGIPPGLGMIMVGPRAWEIIEQREHIPTYYFNLKLYRKQYQKNYQTPCTPSVSHIYALNESLNIMFEEGLDNRFKRHRVMGEALRAGIKAIGLKLFADEEYASNTITSVLYPPNIKDSELRSKMKNHGILIAGGQDKLKGKIFRIAHMNICGKREILLTLSVLEISLKALGFDLNLGESIKAAEKVFLENNI